RIPGLMRHSTTRSMAKLQTGNVMAAHGQTAQPPMPVMGGCTFWLDGVHLGATRFWGRLLAVELNTFRTELIALLPRLRRFARTLAQGAADADDLVQATCERAIIKADQWLDGTRLDSWLYTMMRNLWISEIRSRKVRFGQGQVDASEAVELQTRVAGDDEAYGKQLMGMVKALPEGYATTLLLVAVEGWSYQEAADFMEVPIGTVMSRMSKARQLMKAKLEAVA
ncbi:MAG: RNA polymerase sigma factor, partial [Deltaproteobacteria bacterium]